MKPIGIDAQECNKALQTYSEKIDRILDLLGITPSSMREAKVKEARQLLRNLKDCLRQDYHQRRTERGQAEMSQVERTHFFPALHEALTRIYVRANSTPSQKWIDDLMDAQSSILYYLSQLQDNSQ